MDEDGIDAEALQAQIDLSMSFAQNLVSSWIQPHNIPGNSQKKDIEKELSEYMQRPARYDYPALSKFNARHITRLGVGASIPEGYNSATRETARLKGKLAGTKHSRDDDDIAHQQPSDTEGERRAIAIKKKPKYDPFDVEHGKKKKKEKDIDHEDASPQLITASPNVAQLQATTSPKEASNQRFDGYDPNSLTLSLSKKKKKRKNLNVENSTHNARGSETGASSLCNGSSNVPNPLSIPPRRSAGESALSHHI